MKYADLKPGDLLVTTVGHVSGTRVHLVKMVISIDLKAKTQRIRSYNVRINWMHVNERSDGRKLTTSYYDESSALARDTKVIRCEQQAVQA